MAIVEDVYAALGTVEDPEMRVGIVPLGLVYGVSVSGDANDEVEVRMTFTSPMCPVAPMIKEEVQNALDRVPGVAKATIEITFSPPWDPRTMANDDVKLMLGIW